MTTTTSRSAPGIPSTDDDPDLWTDDDDTTDDEPATDDSTCARIGHVPDSDYTTDVNGEKPDYLARDSYPFTSRCALCERVIKLATADGEWSTGTPESKYLP
jgi:hypothetical protein